MTEELPKFPLLVAADPGFYRVPRRWWDLSSRGGWIEVEPREDQYTYVTWMNGRHAHYPSAFSSRRPTCVKIDPVGNMVEFFRTAVTTWTIWGGVLGVGGEAQRLEGLKEAQWMSDVLREISNHT